MQVESHRPGLAISLGLGLWLLGQSALSADAEKPRFTVRDSVEMSYFGTLVASQPDDLDDDGLVSPDGTIAVKVSHRGVLPSGITQGTIWRFDAIALRRSVNDQSVDIPVPIPLARMSAAVNGIEYIRDRGDTIHQLKWSPDSRRLYFLGRNGQENRQIFQVDVSDGKVTRITPPGQDVIDYSLAGATIAYLAGAGRTDEEEWATTGPGIPDITVGTGTPLVNLLFPNFTGDYFNVPVRWGLWQVKDGVASAITDASTGTALTIKATYRSEALALSRNERFVVILAYDNASDDQSLLRYRLIDLVTGASSILVDVPIAEYAGWETPRYRAEWSPDNRTIAVSNLQPNHGSAKKVASCDVGFVSVKPRQMQCVTIPNDAHRGQVYSFNWGQSGDVLRVRIRNWFPTPYEEAVLDRNSGSWHLTTRRTQPADLPLEFSVKEGINNPPVLEAIDPMTLKRRVVLNPNPQLADKELGSVSPYEWEDGHGRHIKGGLLKPIGFVSGHRYPLVIQTHGFDPDQFYRVGASDTANAGRALAGRGMVVLQVEEPHEPFSGTWQDGQENGTNVYLAAIDKLAAESLIDPHKVGITGYSYTGYTVSTAIARAPDRFAAAVVSNADNGSLDDYYQYVDIPPDIMTIAGNRDAGVKPYGAGLQTWLARAPGFSVDKIQAPVLISAGDPYHLMSLWPLYAPLRDQGKPVDLQYIRTGRHNLTKPLQRLAHEEMLVDWFDFWLNHHEAPDPSKAVQYARWTKLRNQMKVDRNPATY